MFRRFLATGVLLCLMEVFWIFVDGATFNGARVVNWLVNCLYYALCSICAYCWYIFAEQELYSETRQPWGHKFLLALPLVLVLFIDLASVQTGWVFSLDATNHWQRGPYYLIHVLIGCGYILIITGRIFVKALATDLYEVRCKLMGLTYFAIPASIGVILSQFLAGYTLTEVGLTLSALLFYLNLQEQQISLDTLTRLNNRNEFQRVLQDKLKFFNPEMPLYLLVLDIDEFKQINDKYGHIEGDKALKRVAKVLQEVGSAYDCFISRFGGDEFILLCEAEQEERIRELCADIKSTLAASRAKDGTPYNLELSIGYAAYDPAFKKTEEFVARADEHMYAEKRKKNVTR